MGIYCAQGVAGVEGPKFLTDDWCESLIHPGQPFVAASALPEPAAKSLPTSTKYPLLSMTEAGKIVGNFNARTGPRALLKNAIDYMLTEPHQSVEQAIDNLEILLHAVKKATKAFNTDWLFNKFPGVDGSVGFSGSAGHSLLISPKGELFKGMIYATVYRNDPPFVWNANYPQVTKLGIIKIVPKEKPNQEP